MNVDGKALDFARRIDISLSGEGTFADLSDGPLARRELRDRAMELSARFDTLDPTQKARVAVLARSDRTVIAAVTAAFRTGRALIIGDPSSTPSDVQTLLRHCAPGIVICDTDEVANALGTTPMIRTASLTGTAATGAFPDISSRETALLVFTSGTTSSSKIVELTYDNIAAQFEIFADVYGFDANTRLYNLLPFHHVDGLVRGPLAALWFGGAALRPRRFSVEAIPDILADIATLEATHFITVPAILRMIDRFSPSHADAFHTPGFRFILSSADLLDAALWRRIEQGFGVPVANAYGLSEVVCDALFAGPDPASRTFGTIGRPHGVTVAVLDAQGQPVADGDIGELAIAGPTVMRGYFRDAPATQAVLRDGWFHTGDLARRRDDGLFDYVGRLKTVVIVGGTTIYPEGVSEALLEIQGIGEAVAFGVRCEAHGERLVAAVAPEPGTTLQQETVWSACRSSLTPERQPSEILFLEHLPRGPSGKIRLDSLRDLLAAAPVGGGTPASVLEIAARCFNHPQERLSPNSTPFDTPGWDSLAHITLIEDIEFTYDITLSPADIAGLMSLADAIEIVDRETGASVA